MCHDSNYKPCRNKYNYICLWCISFYTFIKNQNIYTMARIEYTNNHKLLRDIIYLPINYLLRLREQMYLKDTGNLL